MMVLVVNGIVRFPIWLQQGIGPYPRPDSGDQTKAQLIWWPKQEHRPHKNVKDWPFEFLL